MRFEAALTKKRLLVLLLGLSAITSVVGSGVAGPMRRAASFFLAPLADAPMYAVTELKARVAGGGGLSAEDAERLRKENAYLRSLLSHWAYERRLYTARAENLANFQRLYGPLRDLPCELVPARVVAAGSLPYDRTRVVSPVPSRRPSDGACVTTRELITDRTKALPPRLAAVTASALVGKIMEAGAFTARLQLVTDRGFRLRGRIRRIIKQRRPRMISLTDGDRPRKTLLTPENNRPLDVLAVGDGGKALIVKDVKEYDNVLPGDLLVTSDDEENIPTEIHVGKVVEVIRDAKDPHRVTLRVQPHAELDSLREVYIIVPLGTPPGGA